MELAQIQKVTVELENEIVGGLISKIFQPLPRELALKIFVPGRGDRRLMLSADPKFGRIHLTKFRMPNPPRPPRFCAYLRAHLENARILKVSCANDDRIVTISCEVRSLESRMKRNLVLELLGRDSNIILIDADQRLIMDCLHHLPIKTDHNRVVLPGTEYTRPPQNPNRFGSPTSQYSPIKISTSRLIDLEQIAIFGGVEEKPHCHDDTDTVNDCVDTLYSNLVLDSLIENFRRQIAKPIRVRIRGLANRARKIENDKQRLGKYIEQAKFGELVKTSLRSLKKGLSFVNVTEWETGTTITVPLDPALDPVSNMRKFFAHSAKGKRGIHIAEERLERTIEEKVALEELLYYIEEARTQEELEVLSVEINRTMHFVRGAIKKNRREPPHPCKPTQGYFDEISPSGLKVFVGKNSGGNDFILRSKLRDGAMWFHVKDAPGSHVVLLSREGMVPDKSDIFFAAALAARHSKLKNERKVEVMYTDVKNVSKIKGGQLGQVRINKYKSLVVSLEE
jgi:predicted ribosome quality control (RQC) complex YloA/Tae2 family protein